MSECSTCGVELSEDTGWAVSTTLAEGAPITFYCEDCNPDKGRGYTLADLQKVREDGRVEAAKYQMSLMDKVGPDVYFAIKDASAREREPMRRLHNTLQDINDTIERLFRSF